MATKATENWFQSHAGSIEAGARYILGGFEVGFQSHAGSIEASKSSPGSRFPQ